MSEEVLQLLRKLVGMEAPYMMNCIDEDEFYELQSDAERLLEEEKV